MNYLVLDLETTTNTKYNRKANPLIPENRIVAYSIKDSRNQITKYIDSLKDIHNISITIEENKPEYLIAHNAKFECLYLWEYTPFQNWLKGGGKIWDTMLCEYILSGQQHKFPALRDIAVNKYNCKEREKVMEAYWDKGIDTKDIPKELVLHDVKNDVLDTEQVYLKQLELVKQAGMEELVEIHNECLLATIEMEFQGLKVDKKVLNQNELKLEKEVQQCHEELNNLVSKYL